jgi:Uncharacterized conserved protein related to C-terminal domain of eukaryotic chaperone, SACSIN
MTDHENIFHYRMAQSEETLAEAIRMLEAGFSPRSIVNRSYYAMFYAVLALFIQFNTPHKTSKHSGVIGIFNKEFIHTGKLDARFSKMFYDYSMNVWNQITGILPKYLRKMLAMQYQQHKSLSPQSKF